MLSIVSLMKEDFEDVAHFIEYHLNLGFGDVLVFYDGADVESLRDFLRSRVGSRDYTIFSIQEIPEIRPHLGPPKVFEAVQNSVHQFACRVAKNPWLITLDADEFLFGAGLDAKFLSALSEGVLSIRLPVAEAVWLPCDDQWSRWSSTGFRTPFRFRSPRKLPKLLRKLIPLIAYGQDKYFFTDNVTGHGEGRHVFRAAGAFDYIGPHHAEVAGKDVSILVNKLASPPPEVKILHYDAISFERWREKIRRRVSGEIKSNNVRLDRRMMFDEFSACDAGAENSTIENQKRLFRRLNCLSWRQYLILRIFHSCFRADPFEKSLDLPSN
ncbi:glycosyltransferase family 2 protein [Thioclava electrotropha]|uniref:Glycosyl transferase family 2 n=1 Tax=Thioclava electrotropha TaxID=1549850 RepID=A0ABX6YQN6_9RHOB|nr:glycosyltransferase family 2 protein [Thioclava electrotropha]QPZ89699.1 hypothetical protein AKL02_001560 [Thioclava electrotropha]